MVVSYWDSVEAIKGYAGATYSACTTCRATTNS